MFKMCDTLKYDKKGAAVVEMSALMPLILFLSAGILFFLFFLLDMAVVKGSSIYRVESLVNELSSCGDDNLSKEEFLKQEERELNELLKQRLYVTRISNCDISCLDSKITIIVTIVLSWPWHGITQYLGGGLKFTSVTKAAVDKRKEWKWTESIISKKGDLVDEVSRRRIKTILHSG